MPELLPLMPVLPLAGFLCLAILGGRMPRRMAASIGAGTVGGAAVIALLIGASFTGTLPEGRMYSMELWTWFDSAGLAPKVTLVLDPLSMTMSLVVTVVGFLIHLYSAAFMEDEEGYSRFFAYMNLFVSSMLVLVLAGDILFLYLGWEGVGLCSYLLIGFWYRDPANGAAARKAFVMTRIGDAAFVIGIILIVAELGTTGVHEILVRAPLAWRAGSPAALAAAALILCGALGKSAQMPLQTWLPDAMAGPTPVSALLHSATMVTAGVYLVARTSGIFLLAPPVMAAAAVIGAATLVMAGCSALAQHDLKRVLAYSTMSQIGLMFLGLGVGAWAAAVFHFMTHAFFKSLLFLCAGAVIQALGSEHDILRMGGLRRELPLVFWTFLIGTASLAGLPLVTAGFYSKDLVLLDLWSSQKGWPWLWFVGLTGSLLTALYSFRMVFLVFFGSAGTRVGKRPGILMTAPLVVLAFLSVTAGLPEMPRLLGEVSAYKGFLQGVLPPVQAETAISSEAALDIAAVTALLVGAGIAALFFLTRPEWTGRFLRVPVIDMIRRLWLAGWGFDRLYRFFSIRPFLWFARITRDDPVDLVPEGAAWHAGFLHRALSRSQNGRVRWYALGIAAGAAAILGIVVY